MKQVNMKHNSILPHFIKFIYRASPVAASGHLHYFLSFPFSHLEAATESVLQKKLFL